ncbi:hypothetical protein [Flagellimonas marina]|uniref:DUF2306 domain-containing protein n=1 Tax=Flagellimonas marina TaxID=1775168 RepID=A0ABV8PNF0_9FLAO
MKATSENRYFIFSAIWFLLIVFWGFAPSFYLSKYFDNPEPLPVHLFIHGISFTLWVLLYAVQVFLIRYRNYKTHMTLGILGVVIMAVMIPTGFFPVVYKAYVGTNTVDVAGHNVFRLLSAYILFGFAFAYRKKAFLHKRLMLGCMVMCTSAAIFRVSFDFGLQASQLFNKGIQIFPAAVLFLFDFVKLKKVVWVDLITPVLVLGIFFFADYFWLSPMGAAFMDMLAAIFVKPFL